MLCGFIIKFTGSFMDLLLPWTLAHMIDEVIPAGRINHIVLWGIFMVLCSILAVTFNIIANRMAARVSGDAVYALREDLFKKTMYLSSHQIDSITRPSPVSYTHLTARPLTDKWTFSTNGVSIMGRNGIPCIGFGPGAEAQAHAPNLSLIHI